ncbi:hypothetical protein GCQ56_00645 [Marinifilum sp. N1E240]|uniref:hypothetical protein n=1 Tax=Marinifilum sp. N1E240 TaxID=2608082 RepID=UPI00128CC0B5|nr:hypothetical protein [Marinifilum sp. N1E240]MPQ45500.1 hypothetical protein [Marinifilum sp. N1E240]
MTNKINLMKKIDQILKFRKQIIIAASVLVVIYILITIPWTNEQRAKQECLDYVKSRYDNISVNHFNLLYEASPKNDLDYTEFDYNRKLIKINYSLAGIEEKKRTGKLPFMNNMAVRESDLIKGKKELENRLNLIDEIRTKKTELSEEVYAYYAELEVCKKSSRGSKSKKYFNFVFDKSWKIKQVRKYEITPDYSNYPNGDKLRERMPYIETFSFQENIIDSIVSSALNCEVRRIVHHPWYWEK